MIYPKSETRTPKGPESFEKLHRHIIAHPNEAHVLAERQESQTFRSQSAYYKGCAIAYEMNGTSFAYLTVISDNENRTKRVFSELSAILFG